MTGAFLSAPTQWEASIEWSSQECPIGEVPLDPGWGKQAQRKVAEDGVAWYLTAVMYSAPHPDEQFMRFNMTVTVDERTNSRLLLFMLDRIRNRFLVDFELRKKKGDFFDKAVKLAGRLHRQLPPSMPFLTISLDGPPLRVVKGSSRSLARTAPGWEKHVREAHPSQMCGRHCPARREICHFSPGHDGYCECQWCGQGPGSAPSEVYDAVWKTVRGWEEAPDKNQTE